MNLWLATSHQEPLSKVIRVKVSGTYETSRSEHIRACAATIEVGDQPNVVTVPIEYQVIKSDDGQVLYRWEKEVFGKRFIGSELMSVLTNALKPKAAPTPSELAETRDQQARQKAAEAIEIVQWRDLVRTTINSQAANFTIDGSGSVRIRFDVSTDGKISNVKVLEGSGNTGLDATAVQMAIRADQVHPPPHHQATRVSMKLSFL